MDHPLAEWWTDPVRRAAALANEFDFGLYSGNGDYGDQATPYTRQRAAQEWREAQQRWNRIRCYVWRQAKLETKRAVEPWYMVKSRS
jgi:hypothetical protein